MIADFNLKKNPNSLANWKQTPLFLSAQMLMASFFLALLARISLPLYFSPVPLSLQTFGVMLLGASLGKEKAALAILAYLFEGALGLPVFSAGSFGLMKLMGPLGGYLFGFALQGYLVGYFLERQKIRSSLKIFTSLSISSFVQMSLGVFWLSSFVGFSLAISLGFIPFVLGELLKISLLTGMLSSSSHKKDQ